MEIIRVKLKGYYKITEGEKVVANITMRANSTWVHYICYKCNKDACEHIEMLMTTLKGEW